MIDMSKTKSRPMYENGLGKCDEEENFLHFGTGRDQKFGFCAKSEPRFGPTFALRNG